MARIECPLTVRGLTKRYPAFALEPLDFTLVKGTITGFIGRNGAGKTTSLNAMLGLIHPDAGEALFWGRPMEGAAAEIKRRVGFVSAGMTYYVRKKLKTITEVTRSFYPDWDDAAYRRYMDRFGLEEDKTPAALSNGMKIKYALALALSHGADLMILDEPTSGLDPVSREELVEIFLGLKDEGKTILFSTHITSDLEKCADWVLYLRRGRLAADRSLEDFQDDYRLVECRGEASGALKEAALGICRTREGLTALLARDRAEALGVENRRPTLEEIMTHLDKEDAP